MNENNNNFQDFLSLFSVILGLENLMENREQSADNDVTKANDKQAKFLLEQLDRKFTEQNKMLEEILKKLQEIEVKQ